MSEPISVSDSNFDQLVLQAEVPVLVDFWAPWCRPCLMIAPILHELVDEYDGRITIARMNVDENRATASKYGIMSIPTLILFKKGEPISHIVGLRPKEELKQTLDAAID